MNPFKLFDPSYLFDTRPGSEFMLFWPLLILFVAVFVGSFKVKMKDLADAMRWFSGLSLVWLFFRDQNIPYLGMRFWMILILLAAVAYAIWTWKKQHQKAEAKPVIDHHRQTMEKYLPKKKRR